MSGHDDGGPRVVVEVAADGTRRFNGQTAEERLRAIDRPTAQVAIEGRRTANGSLAGGRRHGSWSFVIGRKTVEVEYVNGAAIDPPPRWLETEWPRGTTPELHRRRIERASLVLRELGGEHDVLRVWHLVRIQCTPDERSGEAFEDALGLSTAEVNELWSRLSR